MCTVHRFLCELVKRNQPDLGMVLNSSSLRESILTSYLYSMISALTSEVLQFSIKHSFEFIDLNEEIDPEGNRIKLL
jgi:hypothetical protein